MNPMRMAVTATLHCLTGCAIGEVAGLLLGTALGLSNLITIVISIALAFVFGYSLSARALVVHGMTLTTALRLVLAADTISILTMEVVDNTVMTIVPGAMNAGLANALFWMTMPLSLAAAFVAAVPVNYYLISRGQGHALVHEHHHQHHDS